MGKRLGWDGLNNSVLFTWGFVEMLLWFWVCFDPLSGTCSHRTIVGNLEIVPLLAGLILTLDLCHPPRRTAGTFSENTGTEGSRRYNDVTPCGFVDHIGYN